MYPYLESAAAIYTPITFNIITLRKLHVVFGNDLHFKYKNYSCYYAATENQSRKYWTTHKHIRYFDTPMELIAWIDTL